MRREHFLTAFWLAGLVMASPKRVWAAEAKPKAPEPFHYDAGGRRDPFVPLIRDGRLVNPMDSKSLEPSKPVLYGVLWDSEGRSIALINDTESSSSARPVKVGDMIGDKRVLEIRQSSVVLGNGGEPMVLEMSFGPPSSDLSSGASTGASTGGEGQ